MQSTGRKSLTNKIEDFDLGLVVTS